MRLALLVELNRYPDGATHVAGFAGSAAVQKFDALAYGVTSTTNTLASKRMHKKDTTEVLRIDARECLVEAVVCAIAGTFVIE